MSLSREAKKGYLFSAILFLVIVAALVLSRGDGDEVESLLGVVPAEAVAVLHVPNVSNLGLRLESAAAGLGVERRAAALRQNMARQLGFDLLDPEALADKGLRPDGGLIVYSDAPLPSSRVVAVLEVANRNTFEQTLLELLGARTGAERDARREIDGLTIEVASANGRPLAAWTYLGDAVLISAGPDSIDRVSRGALSQSGRIGDELWFQRAQEAAGGDADLFAWTTGQGARRIHSRAASTLDAFALGLNLTEGGLTCRLWGGMDAPRRNALDFLKVSSDATALLHELDPEAMAAGRAFVDLVGAWDVLRLVGLPRHVEELSAQLTARGIRLDRDLIPLLEGTFVVDAGMIGEPNLDSLRRMDPRRLNPFLYLKLSILAPITDPERAAELMPDIAESVARALRGRLEEVRVGGREAYEIHYRLGKGMTFGLAEGMLVVAGGENAYEDALERLESGSGGLAERIGDPRVIEALGKEGSLAALIFVPNLVATVRDLPDESFGGGPTGMMLRSMVQMFIEPVSRLGHVTANFSVDDYGALGTLDIGYEPKEVVAR